MGRRTLQAWGAVAGGFLVHLTLGTLYAIGNMVPYVISYIREYGHPDTVTYSAGMWIFALALVGQGSFMFVGGLISNKLGPRWTTLIGSAIVSAGILLTYFTIKVSFYLTVMTYGLVFGAGAGIAYASPLACAMKWMPNRKGLINGLVLAGFGGGSFVFSQVQTAFINPENVTPDKEVGDEKYFSKENAEDLLKRVPYTFLLMGGLFAVMQVIGSMLLTTPDQQGCCSTEENEPLIDNEQTEAAENRSMCIDGLKDSTGEGREMSDEKIEQNNEVIPDVHPLEMLKTRAFYTLWATFLVNGQAIIFISTLYKAFGQTFIDNDRFLSYVGAFASVFNAGGRPIWGHLADRYGFRRSMLILCTCMILLMMTLVGCTEGGKVMYFFWICAIFFVFSGNFALFPTITAKTFGEKYVAVNFGLVFTSQVATGLIGALLTMTLEQHVGWFGMFCIISVFSFVGWLLALSYNIKRNGADV